MPVSTPRRGAVLCLLDPKQPVNFEAFAETTSADPKIKIDLLPVIGLKLSTEQPSPQPRLEP